MGSEAAAHQLRMFFFPYMAAGHMIPMLDMAKLFACRGVASTIITTPSNTALVTSAIQRANSNSISVLCLPLPPAADTGLPDGWDASASIGRLDFQSVHHAIALLRGPLHHLLADHQPDCLISDMFLPWTADIAHELGIRRLIFHGMCFFSLCVMHLLEHYRPQDNVSGNDEPFIVPGLPHPIEMTRSQLPTPLKSNTDFSRLLERMHEAEARSYGVVVNSCYEMEPRYAEHYTKIIGKKAWCVGPVSLCNERTNYKVDRASVDHGGCLAWLESKKPGSVLYVCFGSLIQFTTVQLREIALALEASRHAFIWVVRADGAEVLEWLSEGFEERTAGRGMIIRGWAPQILILNHEAVGGFLTHCGWNSVLEGVSAGVPMVTWPIFADQSFNEKLVVDMLEIGVRVGARIAGEGEAEEEVVKSEKIERAVDWVMGSGEKADRRRTRARRLGQVARRAVEEGGSSYRDMGRLIEELMLASKRARE